MFVDENSVWPAGEPRPPKPTCSSERAARLFLAFALLIAFVPFSIAALVDLIRHIVAWL